MLKLLGQDYIKHLYENEDLSINEISKTIARFKVEVLEDIFLNLKKLLRF